MILFIVTISLFRSKRVWAVVGSAQSPFCDVEVLHVVALAIYATKVLSSVKWIDPLASITPHIFVQSP